VGNESAAAPVVTSAPKAPSKPTALKTITCVKGSMSKKVTAAKPLCPADNKQK